MRKSRGIILIRFKPKRQKKQLLSILLLAVLPFGTGCKDKSQTSQVSPEVSIQSTNGNFQFDEATNRLNLKHLYNNGEDSNEFSILETIGGGVAVFDYDRDGLDDLYFASGGRLENKTVTGLGGALWRNQDAKQFQETTESASASCSSIYTHGTISGDLNNDGFTDLLVTGYYGLALFINLGDGTFQEQSSSLGLIEPKWGTSAAFGDFDNDGNLDIYITHYVNWSFDNHPPCKSAGLEDVCAPGIFTGITDVIWMNNGEGTFLRRTNEIGLVPEGKGLGVITSDFNDDGLVDIYVANDTTNNLLYSNKGGSFEEIGLASGTAVDDMGTPQGSMGLCTLDFDSDARPDLMVANYENQAFALYKNDGGMNFRYATSTTGLMALGTTYVAWGTVASDFDLDGDEDVVVVNGHVMRGNPPEQLPLMLQNMGGTKFQLYNFPTESYFQKKWRGRGLVKFDQDNDGDLDLAITHINQDAAILQNTAQSENNWWIADLVGTQSNRDAIGSKLLIKTNKRNLLRSVVGGGSYLSQNPYYVHWAVPKGEVVESIEVTWPSGKKQEISGLVANSKTLIVEPSN